MELFSRCKRWCRKKRDENVIERHHICPVYWVYPNLRKLWSVTVERETFCETGRRLKNTWDYSKSDALETESPILEFLESRMQCDRREDYLMSNLSGFFLSCSYISYLVLVELCWPPFNTRPWLEPLGVCRPSIPYVCWLHPRKPYRYFAANRRPWEK